MGYIDAHVHVWTDDVQCYPLAAGFTPAQMNPPTFPPETLFAHCRSCGVDRIVLIQMSYYGTDNRYMLDAIAQYPEAFAGVAIVDHTDDGVEAEMVRLKASGVGGFRVQPHGAPPGGWFDDAEYGAMLRTAAREQLAICPLIDPEYLPAVELAARRHPECPFVIDHLARVGCGRPVRQEDADLLCRLAALTNVHVKVSAFYALGDRRPPHDDLIPLIRQVREAYGAERLLWASDCPFQVQHETYADSIDLIQRLDFLTADDRRQLLEGTAARLFWRHR